MHLRTLHRALLLACVIVFIWSGIGPFEYSTWILETFPAILASAYLIWTYNRFRFTTLVYALVAIHAAILMIGGHYTYAQVPLFNWIRDHYGVARNYYDRLGHFAQGFVPAMVAREVLVRRVRVSRGAMLNFLILCICMAISAWYEIMEFAAARVLGASADNFLGTQGDVWDTQWDMTMCFIGAVSALLLLSRWHDGQLRLMPKTAAL